MQIHTTSVVITEVRHDDTAGIGICKWEETEWNSQWQWYFAYYQIGWTKDYIFLGLNLTFGHLQVEMWVVVIIACGIFATMQHERIILHFFCFIGNQKSFALFGYDMANLTLLGLEIVGEFFGFVAVVCIFEYG